MKEVPKKWGLILSSREKPSSFKIVNLKPLMLFDSKMVIDKYFFKSSKIVLKIKNIREFKIEPKHSSILLYEIPTLCLWYVTNDATWKT